MPLLRSAARRGFVFSGVTLTVLLSACGGATQGLVTDDGTRTTGASDAGPDGLSPVAVSASTWPTFQLVGKVVDLNGVPVPDAVVSVGEESTLTAADGWLGLAEPNDHPYDVTADAIEDSLRRIEPGTILRPWLQAFWWTNAQIRRSIQAAEDRDVGWILWNAVSNFSRSAIPTDAEVADS